MKQQERYNKLFNYVNKEIGEATQPTIIKFIFEEIATKKQELNSLEEKENQFIFTWLSKSAPHTWQSIFNYLRDTDL